MASATAASPTISTQEPRLCWICQQDETEDESPMVWKSPCPCSLTAHDTCLLEWITSQELVKRDEGNYNAPIQCPQCQATIAIERPHDYLVQAYTFVSGLVGSCVIPTALSGLLGCVYSGFLVYGINTVQLVFGRAGAESLLRNIYPQPSLSTRWLQLTRDTLRWSLTAFDPFFPEIQANSDWRIFIGLPLIGPCLILSRTRFADRALPLLLPLYFLDPSHQRLDFTKPITPGFAFAALPYLRAAYSHTYDHFITPHEQRWDQAVLRKPREGETAADIAAEAQRDQLPFEIQVVEEGFEDEGNDVGNFEVDGAPPVDAAVVGVVEGQQQEGVANVPQQVGAEGAQVPGRQQPQNANGNQPAANGDNENWQIRRDVPLRQIMIHTMGALFFPTVASYSGEVLNYALPTSLTSSRIGLRNTSWHSSLLRAKWGRTIIGGCLFVLLKDAVTLYVKWKRARDFGKKRILDYTGPSRRTA